MTASLEPYPDSHPARDRWIRARRPQRNALDPRRAYGAFVEEEVSESGERISVATLLLTNRECPWRCLMCDLWKNTLEETVPPGAIEDQIREVLGSLPPARQIKLYNAGSFFDLRAIPREDHPAIARLMDPFERVIVESHPSLVGGEVFRFRDRLRCSLEVAMGLETVHPEVLPRLNKRMTLEGFRRAAGVLAGNGVSLRAFVLAGLPWVPAAEALEWTIRSIAFAFDCGATAVSVLGTRANNGAMEELAGSGLFVPPTLGLLEECLAAGLRLRRGRVFVDLWELDGLSRCEACFEARSSRLRAMNLAQAVLPAVACEVCRAA